MNGNLRALTRDLVRRHTDFGSLENYLDGYSIAGDTLRALTIPAMILTAVDDPVIPIADFRALNLAPTTELVVAEHGGHCGFIQNWHLTSWAEDLIVSRMQRFTPG
jgi:predicted alpha/beta-fold hydrolase